MMNVGADLFRKKKKRKKWVIKFQEVRDEEEGIDFRITQFLSICYQIIQ